MIAKCFWISFYEGDLTVGFKNCQTDRSNLNYFKISHHLYFANPRFFEILFPMHHSKTSHITNDRVDFNSTWHQPSIKGMKLWYLVHQRSSCTVYKYIRVKELCPYRLYYRPTVWLCLWACEHKKHKIMDCFCWICWTSDPVIK